MQKYLAVCTDGGNVYNTEFEAQDDADATLLAAALPDRVLSLYRIEQLF
jgi:hypothetical protein